MTRPFGPVGIIDIGSNSVRLVVYAGSERVLEQLLLVWPEADVFAVCDFLPEAERGSTDS